MPPDDIKINNIVTRACNDRYRVLSVDDWCIKAVCIKAPEGNNPYINIGNIEYNLKRRFKLIK